MGGEDSDAFPTPDGDSESSTPATESEVDWIRSVRTLEDAEGPVEANRFNPDLTQLDTDDVEFLATQTERTLDRHAEIEQNQNQHAMAIIRITITILGILLTATPFIAGFFKSLTYAESIPGWQAFLALIFLIMTVSLAERMVLDIVSIIDSTFDILSPEATKRGYVGKALAVLDIIGPEVRNEEAGAGVRSVSILNELAPVIEEPKKGLETEVVINRLNRIRRNEEVIDQNIDHLHDIYQRAKLGLERAIAIVGLVMSILFLLGAQL
jgi:hypothetical protein